MTKKEYSTLVQRIMVQIMLVGIIRVGVQIMVVGIIRVE
jgi:hypothetical protein